MMMLFSNSNSSSSPNSCSNASSFLIPFRRRTRQMQLCHSSSGTAIYGIYRETLPKRPDSAVIKVEHVGFLLYTFIFDQLPRFHTKYQSNRLGVIAQQSQSAREITIFQFNINNQVNINLIELILHHLKFRFNEANSSCIIIICCVYLCFFIET